MLDLATGALTPIDTAVHRHSPRCAPTATASCSSPARPRPGQRRDARPQDRPATVLQARRPTFSIAPTSTSPTTSPRSEPIEFPTAGGNTAFGLFYPPHNPDYAAPAGEKPPLVVKCHGGPTSAASSTLSLGIQYWTSRGIAVLDVNYGGSTGFGRAYRERLNLQLGRRRRRRLRQRREVPRRAGPGRRQAQRHHRRQRRRLHDARRARVPRFLPGRRQPLRRQRRRGAGARHPQVRVALSRLADRTLSAGGGALPRALAAVSTPSGCRSR